MDELHIKGGRDFMYAANHIISLTRTEPNEELAILHVFKSGKSEEVEKLETGIEIMDEIKRDKEKAKGKVYIWSTHNNKTQGE